MHTVVERELEMQLVLSPERSIPVPARLVYRSDDPFAVHITFHVGSDLPVNWTFARELIVEGVFRPCGHGDVRIWPTKVGGRSVLCMALSSPDGEALLEAPSTPVAAWLEPALTTVHQPLHDMAGTATRLLLDLASGAEVPMSRIDLGTELVIRESTAPPRPGRP